MQVSFDVPIFVVLMQLATLGGVLLIKFNDLRHVEKDVQFLKTEQLKQGKTLAMMKGRCFAMHSKRK